MKLDLTPYAGKKICVAVSGGKDSMALLHYLKVNGGAFGIRLCALNCDHGIRGAESERDSAFVAAYCGGNSIPLHTFKAQKGAFKDENSARIWRQSCYAAVLESGAADAVATAHHLNDNAETVLFNLARGSALSGLTGIGDLPSLKLIRPMIAHTREEIDNYIAENGIPFVTDTSNDGDGYTRNRIRHNVLPALEDAVCGAAENIYRFSRLAAEDEEYFARQVSQIVTRRGGGCVIKPCAERVIFRRAAHAVVAGVFGKKDYTAEHFNRMFALQGADNGKRFEFLGLVAVKEEGGVAVVRAADGRDEPIPFWDNFDRDVALCGGAVCAARELKSSASATLDGVDAPLKILKFDMDKIPRTAVIRFRRTGDRFEKFGGGTKSLSDYLTDRKVPQTLRDSLPLVCDGGEVLIVGGVEISDKLRTDAGSRVGVFVCADPFKTD